MIQNVLIETNAIPHKAAAAGAQASKGDGLAGLFAALLQSLQGSAGGQTAELNGAEDADAQSATEQAAETPAPGVDDASELASLLAGLTAPVKGLETSAAKAVVSADTGGAAPESANVVTGANGVSAPASVLSTIAPAVSEPRGAPVAALSAGASSVDANAPPIPAITVPVVEGPGIAAQAEAASKSANADAPETITVKPEAFTVAAAAASESDAGVEVSVAAPVVRAGSRVTRDAPTSFVPVTDAANAVEGAVQVRAATPASNEAALTESDVDVETAEPRVAVPANPRAETVPFAVTRETLASLEVPAAETVRAELTAQGKTSASTIEGAALPVDAKAPLDLPEVRVQRVGDLVVQSLRQSGNGGERTIRVQLVPESLGEMRITIRTSGDEVNVLMAVKHAAARETLELHMHTLRETLATEGFEPGKVSVQVSTGSDTGPNGFGRFGDAGGQEGRPGQASRSYPPQPGADEKPQSTRRSSNSTLDVLA